MPLLSVIPAVCICLRADRECKIAVGIGIFLFKALVANLYAVQIIGDNSLSAADLNGECVEVERIGEGTLFKLLGTKVPLKRKTLK